MGLDLVELVVRFEDAFGIAIPDKVELPTLHSLSRLMSTIDSIDIII